MAGRRTRGGACVGAVATRRVPQPRRYSRVRDFQELFPILNQREAACVGLELSVGGANAFVGRWHAYD